MTKGHCEASFSGSPFPSLRGPKGPAGSRGRSNLLTQPSRQWSNGLHSHRQSNGLHSRHCEEQPGRSAWGDEAIS